jgi:hypothetical protein
VVPLPVFISVSGCLCRSRARLGVVVRCAHARCRACLLSLCVIPPQAKAEGRVYLGDPLKHPITNEVTVKPCGTPQPDPWAFVISAKESARQETARMMASPKPESERMSEEARNLARMGMPLGDNPYEMQTEAREKWSGRGFSPNRGKREDSAGGLAPENNKSLHLEWAKIQSIQPRLRLKPDEVKKYEMYKGTR